MFDGNAVFLVWGFVTLGLLMAIVAVITGRHLPDPTSSRPRAIYLSVAMLPLLVIGVIAAAAFIDAAVELILGPESGQSIIDSLGIGGGGLPGAGSILGDLGLDPKDAIIRTLVASGITAVVAFAVYRLHLSWRRGLTDTADFRDLPAARTYQAFGYTVVLVFLVIFVVSAVQAGYGVFRAVAPGTSSVLPLSETAERESGIADIVSGLALAAASWWLLQAHWKLAGDTRDDAVTPAVPEPPAV